MDCEVATCQWRYEQDTDNNIVMMRVMRVILRYTSFIMNGNEDEGE